MASDDDNEVDFAGKFENMDNSFGFSGAFV